MALNGSLAPLLASAGVLAYRAFQYRNAATRDSATPPVLPEDRAFLLETAGSSILGASGYLVDSGAMSRPPQWK
jgi:hypothetical protein